METTAERCLVIGIDGVRYDTLCQVRTPNIDALARSGTLEPIEILGPTVSGPSWTTIATGANVEQHGVLDNDFGGNKLAQYPDFLTSARQAKPELRTLAAASWPRIVLPGPGLDTALFQGGGYTPIAAVASMYGEGESNLAKPNEIDDSVTGYAARRLLTDDLDAVFVHLDVVDAAGHRLGTGDSYREAVEASDERVGVLVSALAARPDHASWTILVTTDHGHADGGGHGGPSDPERIGWIVTAGHAIERGLDRPTEYTEIHDFVLTSLGVPLAD